MAPTPPDQPTKHSRSWPIYLGMGVAGSLLLLLVTVGTMPLWWQSSSLPDLTVAGLWITAGIDPPWPGGTGLPVETVGLLGNRRLQVVRLGSWYWAVGVAK